MEADGRVISCQGKFLNGDESRSDFGAMCWVWNFGLSGVAGKKSAAKGIAATGVLEQVVGGQAENVSTIDLIDGAFTPSESSDQIPEQVCETSMSNITLQRTLQSVQRVIRTCHVYSWDRSISHVDFWL